MAQQATGIQLIEGTDPLVVTIAYNGVNLQVQRSAIRDRSFNIDQLKDNIRLAYLIGGYSDPRSVEFLNFINQTLGGLECSDGRWFVGDVTLGADGVTYTITLGNVAGNAPLGITAQSWELTSDYGAFDVTVIRNLAAWTRVEESRGRPSVDVNGTFTADCITRLKAATFWY